MVARDVADDAKFDGFVTSTPKSPAGLSPRKESPERPGYPRGIPGLREDDRPKPIPAAGKPSRPPQREQRLVYMVWRLALENSSFERVEIAPSFEDLLVDAHRKRRWQILKFQTDFN